MEDEIGSGKVEALSPFAIALAEAVIARGDWLVKVKQARLKSRTITHDEYATIYGGYVESKHKVRDAIAEYQRAQEECRIGSKPELTEKWRDWLAMRGINS